MSSSKNKYDALEQIIFEGGLRIVGVHCYKSLDMIVFVLNNAKIIQKKLSASERLVSVTNAKELDNFQLLGGGVGVHWPAVDEDISLKGLLKDEIVSPFGNISFAMAA
ncbi:MAG: DUF2442 domain-containing protein [Bacteroidota bacterium]